MLFLQTYAGIALLNFLANWPGALFTKRTDVLPQDYVKYRSQGGGVEFRLFQSLCKLTGTSAALLPRCLSNFRVIRSSLHPISRRRGFARFDRKTFYHLVNRGPGLLSKSSNRKTRYQAKSSEPTVKMNNTIYSFLSHSRRQLTGIDTMVYVHFRNKTYDTNKNRIDGLRE